MTLEEQKRLYGGESPLNAQRRLLKEQKLILAAIRAENDGKADAGKVMNIAAEAINELCRADAKHGPMAEKVEGLYTLKCEVMELTREVHRGKHDPAAMRKEAIQVAAMAIKFLRDCC